MNRLFFPPLLFRIAYFPICCIVAAFPVSSPADTLVLKEGGIVRGEFLNPDDVPRAAYEMRTDSGIVLSVPVRYFERLRSKEREPLLEYGRTVPLLKDTVASNMEIARWCEEQGLSEQRRLHLNRVVQLDPDHAVARQRLGHQRIDGLWTTREEQNLARGYVLDGLHWRTQQEIDIEQAAARKKATLSRWRKELGKMRAALPSNPAMKEKISAIKAPEAAAVLSEMLRAEGSADARMIYVRALSNIGTPPAVQEIARWSMEGNEPVNDVRLSCFDEIRKHPAAIPLIGRYYASFLDPARCDNATVNRAAVAIAKIGARTMVPELIEALSTTHRWKKKIVNQGNVNLGSGGLVWGEETVEGEDRFDNQDVRRALVELTGQDFSFDKNAWKNWLMQSRKTPVFDARRG